MAAVPPPAPVPEPLRAFSWLFYPLIWAPSVFLRLVAPCPAMKDPIPDDVDVVHTTIPSRTQGRSIKVHVYRKKGVAPSGKVLLNWHGSGFILPRHGEDKWFASWMAQQLSDEGVTVYDLDYRKAPEHPFPAGIEDAEDAILHFAAKEDTTHIAVGGFSAGAMFSIAAAAVTKPILAARNSKARVNSLTAFYPAADIRPTAKRTPPFPKPTSGNVIAPWVGAVFTTAFCVDPRSFFDKRASPCLHAADELPPHFLIVTGNADSLHDDGEDFVKALNAADPPHPDARFVSIPEEGHAWDKAPLCKESFERRDQAYKAALEYIRKGFA